jgi:hypothetical protein
MDILMIKLLWTVVIGALVVAALSVFGLSIFLLKELLRYSFMSGFQWPYWWQPWVGYPVGLFFLVGSGWLLTIAAKVVAALIRGSKDEAASN